MSNIHVSAQPYMENNIYLTTEAIALLKNTHVVHLSLENCHQLTQYSETVSEILLTSKYVWCVFKDQYIFIQNKF